MPKTLIYARDDNHAEDIVRQVRETFGRDNDFAAKITYTARRDGNDPDELLQRFRSDPALRVAVTVDMIATGTDVRPLECVFFMRDVKSPAYFEQMKGRGARTVDPTEFQSVTPNTTAKHKERFVIVDAVGVTDSPLVDATPLQRHPRSDLSLEQLLTKAGTRNHRHRDVDADLPARAAQPAAHRGRARRDRRRRRAAADRDRGEHRRRGRPRRDGGGARVRR